MGHVGCHLTIHFSEDALAFSLLLSSNISKRQPVVEPISSYPFLHSLLVKFLSSKDWFPRDWFLQNWTRVGLTAHRLLCLVFLFLLSGYVILCCMTTYVEPSYRFVS